MSDEFTIDIAQLAAEVITYLGESWRVSDSRVGFAYIIRADGLQLSMMPESNHHQSKQTKIHVALSQTFEAFGLIRGEKQTQYTLSPSGTYCPSINVAYGRGAKTIAAEISRRLLAEAEALFIQLKIQYLKRKESEETQVQIRDFLLAQIEHTYTAISVNSANYKVWSKNPASPPYSMDIGYRGAITVMIDRLTPEQAIEVANLVNGFTRGGS